MLEVNLKEPDDFLKIRETLTRIGVSAFTVAVICAVCLPPMSFIYPYFGLGFNFALDAGLFSVDPVVHADKVSTSTPHEVEAMLVAKATATVRKHGRTRHTLSSSTGAIDDLYSKRSDAPPAKSGHGMKKRKTTTTFLVSETMTMLMQT